MRLLSHRCLPFYGLGDPNAYMSMLLHVVEGDRIGRDDIIRRLVEMQYSRNELEFLRGTYRIRGEIIDIFRQNRIRMRSGLNCLMMKLTPFAGLIR